MTNDQTGTGHASAKATKKDAAAPTPTREPIVVDMGKKTRRQIRKLRKGKPGRLLDRVEDTIQHLRENGALADDAQPIVIVVKERRRNRGKRLSKFWGLG